MALPRRRCSEYKHRKTKGMDDEKIPQEDGRKNKEEE
jgi:hypothetical protein